MALLVYTAQKREKENRKSERSVWVRPYLQRRRKQGHYDNLMRELAEEDPILYRNFLRLEEDLFNEIVDRVHPHIEK